jgi:ABC-type nitrate/sulfonate/bicarbonate transport system substrate-binding protein
MDDLFLGERLPLVWMRSMTKILCALVVLIFSWTTPPPLSAAPEMVIGYANISARVSPLWIAQEKGFFAKYGVAVQPVYMPGSPVMIASLSTG